MFDDGITIVMSHKAFLIMVVITFVSYGVYYLSRNETLKEFAYTVGYLVSFFANLSGVIIVLNDKTVTAWFELLIALGGTYLIVRMENDYWRMTKKVDNKDDNIRA